MNLQGVDGFGELAHAPGAAAELAEHRTGIELGVRPLTGGAEFRVRFVRLYLPDTASGRRRGDRHQIRVPVTVRVAVCGTAADLSR